MKKETNNVRSLSEVPRSATPDVPVVGTESGLYSLLRYLQDLSLLLTVRRKYCPACTGAEFHMDAIASPGLRQHTSFHQHCFLSRSEKSQIFTEGKKFFSMVSRFSAYHL